MAFVIVAAAVLLVAPGAMDRYGRRLAPAEWSRLCAIALASGLVLLQLSLLLIAGPVILRAVGAPVLAAACARIAGPLLPGGAAVGWTAAAAGTVLPAMGLWAWLRLDRVRETLAGDLWLGDRRRIADRDVVVLPVERPLALSLGGRNRSIVISDGLMGALSERELHAVVAHEAAHLEHHHQAVLSLAFIVQGTLGWLAPLRRSVAAQRLAVERWADECAAASAPDGRQAAASSLLRLGCGNPYPAVAAFSDVEMITARVEALRAPPTPLRVRERVLTYLPGAGAGATALPAIVSWSGHAYMALVMAGRCPL